MADGPSVLIGGDRVAGGDGDYDVVNPATEGVVGTAPNASVDDARDAARAAAEALPGWSATPLEQRCALLGRVADLLDQRRDDLVPLVQAEPGPPSG